jgi:hypothetical protein
MTKYATALILALLMASALIDQREEIMADDVFQPAVDVASPASPESYPNYRPTNVTYTSSTGGTTASAGATTFVCSNGPAGAATTITSTTGTPVIFSTASTGN